MIKNIVASYFSKIKMLSLFLVLSFPIVSYAVNPGDVIVSNALEQLGKPYQGGQPPNKEYTYGAIFDLDNWTGGFDCSGLVSYCGELRRHYSVSQGDFSSFVDGTTWRGMQGGDLIPWGQS